VKLLAFERELPGTTADDFRRLARAEAARAWELYQAAVIRELYFRQDRSEAVLILECANVEEAEAALATLPLVEAGLIAFEIIPLGPYPGFARLFGDDVGSRRDTDY
jgi:muconolactone delta-isomerase